MKILSLFATGAGALLIALAAVLPGLSQVHAAQPAAEYAEQTLRSFASARVQVQQVRMEFRSRIQSAQSEEKQNALQSRATEHMVEAIRQEGLTLSTYHEISRAMADHQELRARVKQLMEEVGS